MSKFMIVIEDNEEGVCVTANDIRHPSDDKTHAYNMGCYLVDSLDKYLAANGVDKQVRMQASRTSH